MTHRRTLLAAALASALALAVPAAAPAATAAVTGDDGKAIALTGGADVRVGTMAPTVVLGFDAGEARYVVTVEGPDGSTVGGGPACHAARTPRPLPMSAARWIRGRAVWRR